MYGSMKMKTEFKNQTDLSTFLP